MIVRIDSKDIKLTEKDREMIRKAAMSPIVYDEDCPELTDEELKEFKPVNPIF